MKTSDIGNLVITGSYYISEDGIEDAHGWKVYALKLEEILIKNNGVLPLVVGRSEQLPICQCENTERIDVGGGGWVIHCKDCGKNW